MGRKTIHPTLIIGMHRSGTSTTAAVVQALGVEFGSEDMMLPATPYDNPSGYIERDAVQAINWDILSALGGSWYRPPAFPPGWELRPRLDGLRERVEPALRELWHAPRWGFKDPTMSLTLPFWLSVVDSADVILCVRDPREVSASLLHRYRETWPGRSETGLGRRDWERLWVLYTTRALPDSRGLRRLLVNYGRLLSDPLSQIDRLANFLGITTPVAQRARVRSLIRPELHRQRADERGLQLAGQGSLRARWRYRRMRLTGDPERGGLTADRATLPRHTLATPSPRSR